MVLGAPLMVGAEYLTVTVLDALWQELDAAFGVELSESKCGIQEFLKRRNPAWNLVGRVHFNVAENRTDAEAPFAFLATYTTRLSAQAKAQHLPLGQALREYAGAANKDRLLSLLLPRRASPGKDFPGVMERICRQNTGLFPSPKEIKLSCSCPDWADMCKHVASVLYGIGARLDQQPELLFRLHEVNQEELITKAGKALPLAKDGPAASKVLGSEHLSAIFGLDVAEGPGADAALSTVTHAKPKPAKARADKTGTAVSAGNGKLRNSSKRYSA